MGQIKPHGGLWAVLLQNNLPADIRQSDSIQAFKSNCVKLLISPYSSVSSAVAPITITSSSGSLSVSINLLTLYLLFMSALLPRTQQTICKHFSNFHFSYFLLLSSHLLLLLLSPPPPPVSSSSSSSSSLLDGQLSGNISLSWLSVPHICCIWTTLPSGPPCGLNITIFL